MPIRGLWSSRHTTPSDWCSYFRSWLLAALRRYGIASQFSLMAMSLLCSQSHQAPITIKVMKARHGGPAFGPWPLGPRKSAVSDGCPAVGLTNRWVAFRRASIPLGGSHSLCASAWKRLSFNFFCCSQGGRVGDLVLTGAEFDCPAFGGWRDACESALDCPMLFISFQIFGEGT